VVSGAGDGRGSGAAGARRVLKGSEVYGSTLESRKRQQEVLKESVSLNVRRAFPFGLYG
jgi:hypothetical protein